MKTYFLVTTWPVTLSTGSNLQPHTGVLSVLKEIRSDMMFYVVVILSSAGVVVLVYV